MPPSTRMQRNRQRAAERAILGNIDENTTRLQIREHSSQFKTELANSSLSIGKSFDQESDVFDPTDGFDGLNPAHVISILDDLETEIKNRVESIQDEREKWRSFLRQEGRMLMLQFPMDAKKMTVGEFFQKFGIDIKTMDFDSLEDASGRFKIESGSMKRAKILPLGINMLETPARTPNFSKSIATPSTFSRTLREGEKFFSKNGSPINEVSVGSMRAIVGKKRRADEKDDSITLNLDLHVSDGSYVSLCPENIKKLDNKMKSAALQQSRILKEYLTTIENCIQNQ